MSDLPDVRTVRELLNEAKARLSVAPFAPPAREAHLLLGHVLGLPEARLLARDDRPVSASEDAAFRTLLERRLTGEPVAYLLGEREFYGRVFRVDRRVLVPRPETEHLVETVLALDLTPAARVLDVGVGSGAIGVTLALERPGWSVIGTDRSVGALAVARGNAHRLGAPLGLLAADLTAGLDLATVDALVSNPPYVARREAEEISPEVIDFEPDEALFARPVAGADGVDRGAEGPDDGTEVIARLLRQAEAVRSGTPVVLEIGGRQLAAVRALATAGPWRFVRSVSDLAGFDRVVMLERR